MIVKPPILDREDRIDHVLGNLLQRDVPPLLAARGDERSDERRVERQLLRPGLLADDFQVIDGRRFLGLGRPHPEDDPDGLPLPIAVSRDEHDGIASDRELAGLPGLGTIGIAELVQPVDELPRRHGLTPPHLERPREHARVHALHIPVQPGVDHSGKHDVVVAQHSQEHHGRPRQGDERVELPATPEKHHRVLPGELGDRFGLGRLRGHSCR